MEKFEYLYEVVDYIKKEYGENLKPSEFLSVLTNGNLYIEETRTERRELSDEEKKIYKIVPTYNNTYLLYINGKKTEKSAKICNLINITESYKKLINEYVYSAYVKLEASVKNFNTKYKRLIDLVFVEYKNIKYLKSKIQYLFFHYFDEIETAPSCELLQGLKNRTIDDGQFIKLCKGCEIDVETQERRID